MQSSEAYLSGARCALECDDVPHLIVHLSNLAETYLQLGDVYSAVAAWSLVTLLQIDEQSAASSTAGPLTPILAKIARELHKVQNREDIAEVIAELANSTLRHLSIRLGPERLVLPEPNAVGLKADDFVSRWLDSG